MRKSEAESGDATDPVSLIRKAHGSPIALEDLERGYHGREIAKAEIEKNAVEGDEFFEIADPRPRQRSRDIRKFKSKTAAREFCQMNRLDWNNFEWRLG